MRRAAMGVSGTIAAGLLALTLGASPDSPAAPGDEVMQSTQRALRLTPALSRAMARMWVQEPLWKDLRLTAEQQTRVVDVLSRRLMETARNQGEVVQPILEYAIEAMILADGFHFTPEAAQEFGRRVGPLMPIAREFVSGLADAVGPALEPGQASKLKEHVELQKEAIGRLEERLQRAANGGDAGKANPFDDLNVALGKTSTREPKVSGPMEQARKSAESQVRRAGVSEWRLILQAAAAAFEFDDDQNAKGQALLAEYLKRAEAVKTSEWRDRYYRIAVWLNAKWELRDLPAEPRFYRLERAQREMLKPIDELGRSFSEELAGLATPRQRAAVMGQLRRLAEDNGMPAQERPSEPMNLLLWDQEPARD